MCLGAGEAGLGRDDGRQDRPEVLDLAVLRGELVDQVVGPPCECSFGGGSGRGAWLGMGEERLARCDEVAESPSAAPRRWRGACARSERAKRRRARRPDRGRSAARTRPNHRLLCLLRFSLFHPGEHPRACGETARYRQGNGLRTRRQCADVVVARLDDEVTLKRQASCRFAAPCSRSGATTIPSACRRRDAPPRQPHAMGFRVRGCGPDALMLALDAGNCGGRRRPERPAGCWITRGRPRRNP